MVLQFFQHPRGVTAMSDTNQQTTYNAFLSPEREPLRMREAEFVIGDTLARELFAFADGELEFQALRRLNDFRGTERDVHRAIALCERHGKRSLADQLLSLLTGCEAA